MVGSGVEGGGFKPNNSEMTSDADREDLCGSEVLWEGDTVKVTLPDVSAIPAEEGGHFQITPKDGGTGDWRTDSIVNVLYEGYYALAVARITADSGRSDDLWANVHWNSRPEFVGGCNVFGRNPHSESGWAKPVVMREGGVGVIENQQKRQSLSRFAQRYFPMWEEAAARITVFPQGAASLDAESEEFREVDEGDPNKLVWANEKFAIFNNQDPHQTGLHLVLLSRDEYFQQSGGIHSPWETPENPDDFRRSFLESLAILKIMQELLSEFNQAGKIRFYNPEIHYSGNWAKGMQDQESGGQLDRDKLRDSSSERPRIRAFKREQSPKFGAHMHGHLYATLSEEQMVRLPSRPRGEVPEEWEGIETINPDETQIVNLALAESLNERLSKLAGLKLKIKE